MIDNDNNLSHIIVYVDKKVPETDIRAFCTNIKCEDPGLGFTYLSYDNQSDTNPVNLINSAKESPRSLFIITDSKAALDVALDSGIACAAYSQAVTGGNDLSRALYCIEDIEYMDLNRIRRMWQRHYCIPWTIAVTDRLVIREQTEDDLDSLYEIYEDDEIKKFVEPLYEDRKMEQQYIRDYIANQYRFHEYGLWAVIQKETGTLIGRAGFSFREGYDIPELGYVIGRKYRNTGYAKEALCAIVSYGMEELGLREYMAFTDSRNKASVKLLESLGFAKSGCDNIMGRLHDMYLLTLGQ